MNGNQMMLSIGAMIFLSMLILNVHSSTTDKLIILYSNEAVIEATGLAQALFEEIQTKAFDEATTIDAAKERNLLTMAALLKYETGEDNITDYDDIDDYNGYTDTDSANIMGKFDLAVTVKYVEETKPYDIVNERTFIKRVDISITNESLPTILEDFPNTLFFKKLISY
jgi:hypothetical protein